MKGQDLKEALRRVDDAAFTNISLISPLRYPGGKRRLLPYVARAVASLARKPSMLIEPFAGGAAVSIGLLEHRLVPRIALADADPMVAAFWQAVFDPDLAEQLAKLVEQAPLTLEHWLEQRRAEPNDTLMRAYKCIYLNRTSFSGILSPTAGPIGGMTQAGTYKLGARFPRERIAARIRELSRLAPKVAYVRCQDYATTLENPLQGTSITDLSRLFWYVDPPFWNKAERLYRLVFKREDHEELARRLPAMKGHWVLSYDMDPQVEALYAAVPGLHHVSMRYTARSGGDEAKSRELLFSNVVMASGIAGKSLAVLKGGVRSGYISVKRHCPKAAGKKTA